jgi:hypothetical protein
MSKTKTRFCEHDRVTESFLGPGTVVDPRPVRGIPLVAVRFDREPPLDYNCGQNPTCRFEETLTPLEEDR